MKDLVKDVALFKLAEMKKGLEEGIKMVGVEPGEPEYNIMDTSAFSFLLVRNGIAITEYTAVALDTRIVVQGRDIV